MNNAYILNFPRVPNIPQLRHRKQLIPYTLYSRFTITDRGKKLLSVKRKKIEQTLTLLFIQILN